MKPLKIIFAGTPDFALPALSALIESPHQVIAVYTQPDRPAGRGRKLTASPIKQLAVTHQIPVYQPANFKAEADRAELSALQPELMIVAAYGLLLPPTVLAIPSLGCVNIHASLLPRWRGAAPIQRAILAGDQETGVSIMQMEAGLDTGPVFAMHTCPVAADETGGSLHDKLAALGAQALLATLPAIADQAIQPQAQDEQFACYAQKLNKTEATLDWQQSAVQLDRQIRAFNPWPVAQTQLHGEVLRLWNSIPLPQVTDQPPGTVIQADQQGILVATGNGCLQITQLQQPGKRVLTAAEFLHAHSLADICLG